MVNPISSYSPSTTHMHLYEGQGPKPTWAETITAIGSAAAGATAGYLLAERLFPANALKPVAKVLGAVAGTAAGLLASSPLSSALHLGKG